MRSGSQARNSANGPSAVPAPLVGVSESSALHAVQFSWAAFGGPIPDAVWLERQRAMSSTAGAWNWAL